MNPTANKRKGAKFEIDLLNYLRKEGFEAERLRLTGKLDEGDIILDGINGSFVLEAKATKVVDLAGFVTQAELERNNYVKRRGLDIAQYGFAAVIKRRMKGIDKSYVVTPLDEFLFRSL